MIVLKRSEFPSDDAFLAKIKKYEGRSAQAHLNPGLTKIVAGFAFDTCNGILAFAKFKSDPKTLVWFRLDRCMSTRTLVSQFHTIEIDE
jgi:hypothetical protein